MAALDGAVTIKCSSGYSRSGAFRQALKLSERRKEGRENDIVRETFERTGASVVGKRMFDLGEQAWPEEAPLHTPVFVVTHEKRDPWERPGRDHLPASSTTASSPRKSRASEAAGDRDVRIAGGGATILEYVNASLIDEFTIALSPVPVRLRNPPVRGRGCGPRGPGAGPRGADGAGDPPDLRRPGAVTVCRPGRDFREIARSERVCAASVRRPRRVHHPLERERESGCFAASISSPANQETGIIVEARSRSTRHGSIGYATFSARSNLKSMVV